MIIVKFLRLSVFIVEKKSYFFSVFIVEKKDLFFLIPIKKLRKTATKTFLYTKLNSQYRYQISPILSVLAPGVFWATLLYFEESLSWKTWGNLKFDWWLGNLEFEW